MAYKNQGTTTTTPKYSISNWTSAPTTAENRAKKKTRGGSGSSTSTTKTTTTTSAAPTAPSSTTNVVNGLKLTVTPKTTNPYEGLNQREAVLRFQQERVRDALARGDTAEATRAGNAVSRAAESLNNRPATGPINQITFTDEAGNPTRRVTTQRIGDQLQVERQDFTTRPAPNMPDLSGVDPRNKESVERVFGAGAVVTVRGTTSNLFPSKDPTTYNDAFGRWNAKDLGSETTTEYRVAGNGLIADFTVTNRKEPTTKLGSAWAGFWSPIIAAGDSKIVNAVDKTASFIFNPFGAKNPVVRAYDFAESNLGWGFEKATPKGYVDYLNAEADKANVKSIGFFSQMRGMPANDPEYQTARQFAFAGGVFARTVSVTARTEAALITGLQQKPITTTIKAGAVYLSYGTAAPAGKAANFVYQATRAASGAFFIPDAIGAYRDEGKKTVFLKNEYETRTRNIQLTTSVILGAEMLGNTAGGFGVAKTAKAMKVTASSPYKLRFLAGARGVSRYGGVAEGALQSISADRINDRSVSVGRAAFWGGIGAATSYFPGGLYFAGATRGASRLARAGSYAAIASAYVIDFPGEPGGDLGSVLFSPGRKIPVITPSSSPASSPTGPIINVKARVITPASANVPATTTRTTFNILSIAPTPAPNLLPTISTSNVISISPVPATTTTNSLTSLPAPSFAVTNLPTFNPVPSQVPAQVPIETPTNIPSQIPAFDPVPALVPTDGLFPPAFGFGRGSKSGRGSSRARSKAFYVVSLSSNLLNQRGGAKARRLGFLSGVTARPYKI